MSKPTAEQRAREIAVILHAMTDAAKELLAAKDYFVGSDAYERVVSRLSRLRAAIESLRTLTSHAEAETAELRERVKGARLLIEDAGRHLICEALEHDMTTDYLALMDRVLQGEEVYPPALKGADRD